MTVRLFLTPADPAVQRTHTHGHTPQRVRELRNGRERIRSEATPRECANAILEARRTNVPYALIWEQLEGIVWRERDSHTPT